jgi:D-alanine-D-alanine ligase
MAKKNVLILCGGRSPEHKISLISAQNVIEALDKETYEAIIVGITPDGDWYYYPDGLTLDNPKSPTDILLIPSEHKIFLSQNTSDKGIFAVKVHKKLATVDVVFPVLHGNNGEDGSVQGLCKLAGLPLVGCGISGSSNCIDKSTMKKILRDADIPVAKSITIRPYNRADAPYKMVSEKLGDTLYIKPASLGSSLGVRCINNESEYEEALDEALSYCDKVLVESLVVGREIECAVLGNHQPEASIIGEIIPQVDFYTFENKYVNADGALLSIPAELPEGVSSRAQQLAIKTFLALDCLGLSRVDMFYKENGELLINEVNTLPGFTSISMYPKLWEHAGLSQTELLSKLIDFAYERYEKEEKFKIS